MVEIALRAIADPRRIKILRIIRGEERSAGDISSYFDVTRPAISQHLQVLVNAGLASVRRQGTRRLYQARPEGLAELRAFLEEFWGDRLSLLKKAAESEQEGFEENGNQEY